MRTISDKRVWEGMTEVKIKNRYFECIGNKKLMNQFRKEHPRYYWKARRFWHSSENIAKMVKEQNRKYHQQHKEQTREYKRIHQLKTTNGKAFHGLHKRSYTNYCEICGKLKPLGLKYHHWNKTNPSMGIWVCDRCHAFVEGYDKGYVEVYLQKKQQIEGRIKPKQKVELF